jgi:hypothetical protein
MDCAPVATASSLLGTGLVASGVLWGSDILPDGETREALADRLRGGRGLNRSSPGCRPVATGLPVV